MGDFGVVCGCFFVGFFCWLVGVVDIKLVWLSGGGDYGGGFCGCI